MGSRRKARELALQALFYIDMNKGDPDATLDQFCQNFNPPEKFLPFFLELVNGVTREMPGIDQRIERFSKNWKISRMSCVDRNIIRIAIYEILFCQDIPSKVSINEAIDIGKRFGTEESGSFINGIIDSVRIDQENDGN